MNKREQTAEILQALLKRMNRQTFRKIEIECAIMAVRGSDHRTIRNWWNYFWRMGYFHQDEPGFYTLVLSKVLELESPELNAHQAMLTEHTHTQSSEKEKKEE